MIYIKATVVGIVRGLVLAIMWVVAALWLPVEVQIALIIRAAALAAISVR